jgi:hypothetical protein
MASNEVFYVRRHGQVNRCTMSRISVMSSIAKRTPFPAQTAFLDAAIGHVVDAPRRYVANDDAAYLELLKGTVGVHQVAREDPRLQAELASVHGG